MPEPQKMPLHEACEASRECKWGDTQLCQLYSKCMELAVSEAFHAEFMLLVEERLDRA